MMSRNGAGGTVSVEELNQRLSKDEEWLSGFQEMLGKSQTLTSNVCSLLDSFQDRIDSLSSNVQTLVAKSSVIQKEQQRIRKLLATVDATIQFHGKTTVLENTIRDGGNVLLNLDDFLEKMRNLKEAIAFFSTHPIYRDQLEHIKQIYEIGCGNIESEFGNLVRLNCVPIDPGKVFDCLDEDYEMASFRMSSFLTLRDTQRIHQMATWLLDDGSCAQFRQLYAQYRAENMIKPLRTTADQISANNRCVKTNFVKRQKTDQPQQQLPFGPNSLGPPNWGNALRYGRYGSASAAGMSSAKQKMVVMRLMSGGSEQQQQMRKIGESEEEGEGEWDGGGGGMLRKVIGGKGTAKDSLELEEEEYGRSTVEKGKGTKDSLVERQMENDEKNIEQRQNGREKKEIRRGEKDQFATTVFRLFALKKVASRIADSADQTHRDNAIVVVLFMSSMVLVLIQLETELNSTVFANPSAEADVLRQIMHEPLRIVLSQALKVVDSYEGNFAVMLPLAKFYLRHANQLVSLSENVGQHALFASFQSSLFRKCVQLIKVYLERLQNDQIGGRFVPEDGNVHPVSSGTINFLKLLVQNQKLLTQIYARAAAEEPSSHAADSSSPAKFGGQSAFVGGAAPSSPAKLFAQILSSLGVSLRHKSAAYSDPHLGALFMFNNLGYIAQCCTKDKQLLAAMQQGDPHLIASYEADAEQYLQRYLESWAKIGALFSFGTSQKEWTESSGNDRKTIKNIFTTFNQDFDAIIDAQKNFCLSDQTMARDVRNRIKQLVLRPFTEFSIRNARECSELFETERQLKYDAETVEMIIDRLFNNATL